MQSIEQFGKAAASGTVARNPAAGAPAQSGLMRFGLVFMPVALVASMCLVSFAMRAVHGAVAAAAGEGKHDIGATRAMEYSRLLCRELAHQHIQADMQTVALSMYSARRKVSGHEYEVICHANSERQYLIRIDSETGHVFAFDLLDPGRVDLAVGRPAGVESLSVDMSPEYATAIASRDLQLIGTSPSGIELVEPVRYRSSDTEATEPFAEAPPSDDMYDPMYYEFRVPATGKDHGEVAIAIDRRTGDVGRLWNPSI